MSGINPGPNVQVTPNVVAGMFSSASSAPAFATDQNGNVTGITLPSNAILPIRPYLGLVANRGGCCTNTAGGGNGTMMARTKHVAMDGITSLQIVLSNWYCFNGTETAPGATASFTASIEYPAGTIAGQIKFNGNSTGQCASGLNIVYDSLSVNIPKGNVFYVRVWQSLSTGILWRQIPGAGNVTGSVPLSGEWINYGAAIADTTMSTANSNNLSNTVHYRCAAIIGWTTRPSFLLVGDSRASGEGGEAAGGSANGFGLIGPLERNIGKSYASYLAASSTETLSAISSGSGARRLPFAQYCSHIICDDSFNDIAVGNTLLQLQSFLATFAAIPVLGNKPIYQTTQTPYTTSSDSWATTTNQTPQAGNAVRITWNNSLRSGGYAAPIVGFIEIADFFESARDSGLLKVNGTASAYTPDGIHQTKLAQNYLLENQGAFGINWE